MHVCLFSKVEFNEYRIVKMHRNSEMPFWQWIGNSLCGLILSLFRTLKSSSLWLITIMSRQIAQEPTCMALPGTYENIRHGALGSSWMYCKCRIYLCFVPQGSVNRSYNTIMRCTVEGNRVKNQEMMLSLSVHVIHCPKFVEIKYIQYIYIWKAINFTAISTSCRLWSGMSFFPLVNTHRHLFNSLTVTRFMSSCLRWSTQHRTACLYHVSRAIGFPSRVSSEREHNSPRQASWSKLERKKRMRPRVKATMHKFFPVQEQASLTFFFWWKRDMMFQPVSHPEGESNKAISFIVSF